MANNKKSKFKIGSKPPKGWKEDVEINLVMYYFNKEQYYVFVYEVESAFRGGGAIVGMTGKEPVIAGRILPYEGGVEFKGIPLQYLDIGLDEDDDHALITVKTIDKDEFKDLYWDQVSGADGFEAIMTEKSQEAFYGELKYSSTGGDNDWHDEKPAKCRYIRFKANVNKGKADKHKFSYNVRMPYGVSNSVQVEIDPEIQNPRT